MQRFVTKSPQTIALFAFLSACAEEPINTPEIEDPEAIAEQEAILVEELESIADRMGFANDETMSATAFADESPAFGSEVFAEAFGVGVEGPEMAAEVAAEPEIASIAPERAPIYHVMALWGRLRPNQNAWSRLRWNPALRVAEGDVVRVRRSIFFEPGDVVHPQEVRSIVEMSSITGPHVDGVIAQVALPRPILEATPTTVAPLPRAFLAFESTPFSVTIPAGKLDELGFMEIIDDVGNGVMLTAVRRMPSPCAVGFMAGRWARTSNTGGVFGGVWQQTNGRREGYVVGRWGVTATGEQRFRGKVVNLQGEFLAYMSGGYDDGEYKGELHGRGGAVLGHVRGRYSGEDGHGVFQGVWRQACTVEPPPHCLLTVDDVRICQPIALPESGD
jgi:hypothetical protein